MYVFIGVITNPCEAAEVWVARVINEACWAGEKLSIDLEWWSCKSWIHACWVREFVQGKEIDVFALCDF